MSSTSAQIDEAKRIDEAVEKGEYVPPMSSGGATAAQLSAATPQQPDVEIPEDATMGGLNRENMKPVDKRETIVPVGNREIAPVVGEGQEHSVKDQFKDPRKRSEEQTSVESQLTTAQKQTQIGSEQAENADKLAHMETSDDSSTAAKQTKLNGLDNTEVAKVEKAQAGIEEDDTSSSSSDSSSDDGEEVVLSAKSGDVKTETVTKTTVDKE